MSVGRAELEFASFPSDPMCAEVVAAIGEWEIIKEKKQRSRNVKQAASMGEESVAVGLAFPHVFGVLSRQKSGIVIRNKGQDRAEKWHSDKK
ncbi:hypothetical protein OIU77_017409 [Salix suchowensis]|uniref:Uncharacterized protein n=1 Tax=Salix suchowensis TaxID=1278906 RepID=A0ABQ8ZNN0_9ROSI|nr:hypothetical protein OIU77_017409 [Salix suchowensis]